MKLIREPLLHFLVIGALLFVFLSGRTGDEEAGDRHIRVTSGQIERLEQVWRRTWLREPTPGELDKMIDDYVTEEIYYREALALGLDKDDTVIRRRLKQKMEFLTDDLSPLGEPGDDELRSLLAAEPDVYRIPARHSFVQIYLSVDLRGDTAVTDAEKMLERLRADDPVDPATLGDPLSLPRSLVDVSEDDVSRLFGDAFTTRLETLPVGRWSGPVSSGFGLHLVWVDDRVPARAPTFEEVRDRLRQDWEVRERNRRREALATAMRERYTVEIERGADAGGGR